jgi:hypothetical protein
MLTQLSSDSGSPAIPRIWITLNGDDDVVGRAHAFALPTQRTNRVLGGVRQHTFTLGTKGVCRFGGLYTLDLSCILGVVELCSKDKRRPELYQYE